MKGPIIMVKFNSYHSLRLIGISLLAALIASCPAASLALPYGLGSRVNINDQDVGHPLHMLCSDLRYRDIGDEINNYDLGDPVYLDTDGDEDGYVETNDIRITPFFAFPPGSKVKRTDPDINAALIQLKNWSIACFDLNGNEMYDLCDQLYLHNRNMGNETASGDIRITSSRYYPSGSKVKDSDIDLSRPIFDLMGIMSGDDDLVCIKFYNANGNFKMQDPGKKNSFQLDDFATPIYDNPDQIYLDIISPDERDRSTPSIGHVDVNDLRLSI
jgi:hypothetical protein